MWRAFFDEMVASIVSCTRARRTLDREPLDGDTSVQHVSPAPTTIKPNYVDVAGVTHSYCGKTCARTAVKSTDTLAMLVSLILGARNQKTPRFVDFVRLIMHIHVPRFICWRCESL